MAVRADVERLDADGGVDRRLGRDRKRVFRRAIADEVGPQDVEFLAIFPEVFADVDERVVRAGSLSHY